MSFEFYPIINQITVGPTQSKKPQSKPAFTGLQSAMKKNVYVSPETLQKLMGVYKWNDGIVGNLPPEMIKSLIKQGADMKTSIAKLTQGFSNAVVILKEAEALGNKIAEDIDIKQTQINICRSAEKKPLDEITDLLDNICGMGAISPEQMQKIEKKAATALTNTFKSVGLLPKDGEIKVKRLSEGAYGNTFELSFNDVTGEKTFHDKVLKVFKDQELEHKSIETIAKKTMKFYNKMTLDDFIIFNKEMNKELINSMEKNPNIDSFTKICIKKAIEQTPKSDYKRKYLLQKQMTLKDYMADYNYELDQKKPFHGITAEANRAMFLKGIDKNIEQSNYINHYFYDLSNQYALTEMSDNELPAVTHEINLDKYGLYHCDIDSNSENTVNGRIVDFGGIIPNKCIQNPLPSK